jgi:hypothetical protein
MAGLNVTAKPMMAGTASNRPGTFEDDELSSTMLPPPNKPMS